MDDLDKRILTQIQTALPVAERPFDALAERLGLSPDNLLTRIRRLASVGVIRRIGPVFDSGQLGYISTLVAAKVPADRVEDVAAHVNRLPGVTHNYERRGAYNLWFTLTAPSRRDLESALEHLRRRPELKDLHSLPAEARYKIRATFDLTGAAPVPSERAPGVGPGGPAVPLSEKQKALVRAVQDGLPVEREPFAEAARRTGWTVSQILEQMRAWLAAGVIRRFGAVLRHREAGVLANGMAVFQVDAGNADAAGRALAAHAEVTHCYRRRALPDFPHNLYAMVHGRSEDEVRATAAGMADEVRAAARDVLFSAREFKKTSMRYFTEGEAAPPNDT